MSQGHASELTTRNGVRLALQDWPLPDRSQRRGQLLLVHGLGEHAGRYVHVAQCLNEWGFSVRAYDQHGHGRSEGERGSLPTQTRLLDDLAEVVDATRSLIGEKLPLVLLGHSLGGLVAASLVARGMRPVEALIMSSPALDPGLNPVQKLLVALLSRLRPDLRLGNGLNANFLSHDPQVARAYLADPLVHDRISARLARFIADEGAATLARAPDWRLPTLLLYAGQDRLVSPAGSREFAATAPPALLQAYCFESLYHEIFNEVEASPVFTALKNWLDARFPA